MDVNWPKQYTIKFACLYLKKCEREKQKTDIDCQIYKMRMRLENSFAPNSFGKENCQQKFRHCIPTKVEQLCKTIRVVIFKIEGRKNGKLKLIARF